MIIKEIAAIICGIGLFFLYFIILYLLRSRSVKKNIKKKATIIIGDKSTVLLGVNNEKIFEIKPNTMVYKIKRRGKFKIISFGGINETVKPKVNSWKSQYKTVDIIRDKDIIAKLEHFWFNYITYLSLKAKERIGLSKFAIPSLELKVDVSSEKTRDIIFAELKKIETINKPKLFNILNIGSR
jgi:hypothetical protein